MNKVDFLGDEAYIPKSLNPDIPRGIRNCNPLNIRYNSGNNWEGKYPRDKNNDGREALHPNNASAAESTPMFEQFQFMRQGFLAAFKLIGNTYMYRHKLTTLSAIIHRWCPKGDGNNDPEGYVKKVCAWMCGTPPKGEIHTSVLVAYGETLTFVGSLLGIDYHYRYTKKE